MFTIRKLITPYKSWWGDDRNITTAAIKFSGSNIQMGTPVIVDKSEYDYAMEGEEKGSIRASLYFPLYPEMGQTRNDIIVPADSIYFTDPKNVVNGRQVKEIDQFDFSKLPKIQELLEKEGALTFVMSNLDAAITFIDSVREFTKYFGYSTAFGLKRHTDKVQPPIEGDNLCVFVDMYDLQYVMPVLEPRKSKGMAVNIGLYWSKASEIGHNQLYVIEEYQFAVNCSDINLLKVDGETVRKTSLMGDSYKTHMIDMLAREKLRKSKAEKTQKPVQEKKKMKERVGPVAITEPVPCEPVSPPAQPLKVGNPWTINYNDAAKMTISDVSDLLGRPGSATANGKVMDLELFNEEYDRQLTKKSEILSESLYAKSESLYRKYIDDVGTSNVKAGKLSQLSVSYGGLPTGTSTGRVSIGKVSSDYDCAYYHTASTGKLK